MLSRHSPCERHEPGPDIRSNQPMGEEKLCERYIPVECQLQEVQRDYQRFFQSRDAVERYRQNDHQIQDENQLPRQLLLGRSKQYRLSIRSTEQ